MVVAERIQLQRLSVAHRACALSLVPCLTSATSLPMPPLGDGCGIMVLKRESLWIIGMTNGEMRTVQQARRSLSLDGCQCWRK